MGTFINGLLQGSAVFFKGDGKTYSFSAFKDGRPLDGTAWRKYHPHKENSY
jgi:hypothetical protein